MAGYQQINGYFGKAWKIHQNVFFVDTWKKQQIISSPAHMTYKKTHASN
jgi:hypothetical protein